MPFDFKKFDAKCSNMSVEELQREWEHYTRLISGAATSTAVSGVAIPFTLGVSVIGVGMAAPAIHNARRKREIIERHLQRQETRHNTRKRDVFGPMAISGTVGVVTLGVGSFGADAIATAGAEHGISMIVENEMVVKAGTHLALDAAVMKGEDVHATHKKETVTRKALQKVNASDYKTLEMPASNDTLAQYDPVPIPPSYCDSDVLSTDMNEKLQGYHLCAGSISSLPTTPAPPYDPSGPLLGYSRSTTPGPASDSEMRPTLPPRPKTEAIMTLPSSGSSPEPAAPEPMQPYASYPATILPIGHPGQYGLVVSDAAHACNLNPTSTVAYQAASKTQIPRRPVPMSPPPSYTMSPTLAALQTYSFPQPPQQQYPYSPPETPLPTYALSTQANDYFSQAPSHKVAQALLSPTPAPTPYMERPLEKHQQRLSTDVANYFFPPPPTSLYRY